MVEFKLTNEDLYNIYIDPILDPKCDEETKKKILLVIAKARIDGYKDGLQKRNNNAIARARYYKNKAK